METMTKSVPKNGPDETFHRTNGIISFDGRALASMPALEATDLPAMVFEWRTLWQRPLSVVFLMHKAGAGEAWEYYIFSRSLNWRR